jgi:hypothetical protein
MKTVCPSETLVSSYKTTRRHKPVHNIILYPIWYTELRDEFKFEVLMTALGIYIVVFWVFTPYSLVCGNQGSKKLDILVIIKVTILGNDGRGARLSESKNTI